MSPDEILRENRRRAQVAAQEVGAARLRKLLERAQADLNDRIARAEGLRGAGADSFTAVRSRMVLAQVKDVLRNLTGNMRDLIVEQAVDASDAQTASVLRYLAEGERLFAGTAQPLGISQAAVLDHVRQGAESSALRRIVSDPNHRGHRGVLDRYGASVIGKFEETLQQRALTGKPWGEVREQLVGESPFLQQAPAHWAERIVRTEVMAAHNTASQEAMTSANDQLGGGMLKILCATFDARTSWDSYQVHGQVRRVSEPFNDWEHAYMHPPNRPNDREVVVPHRIHWPVPATLKPRGDGEVAARWSAEGRKGSPPARPLMSTVDMAAEVKAEIARSEQPTSAPKPEVAPVFAPTPVPAQPVRRTPRFRTENERRLYAEDRLGQIPRDEALSIPGFDVIRPPLRSADPEERASYIEARTRSVELARTLRALEAAGTAPPLRQVRVEQVVAVDPAFRSNVQEAIQRSGEASQIAPILIRRGGVLYAHENVEEVVAAHLAERRTVQAHVIDLDAKKPWPTPPKKIEPPPVSTPTSRPRVPVELVSKDFAAHADAAGLEVFDHAKFNAAASKVFTRGMPTVDTLQKTWGSDEAGHTIKLTSAGAYGSRVSFSGDIMAGSRKIGSITRTFIRHDDGTLEVHHDFFKIEDVKEQGSKSGSTMLRQAIQTYEKIGVNEVTVDAAWVGRYAWATFGYNWDAGTARERGHGLGVYLQSKGVEAARAKTIAEQAAKRAWDVAALDVDGITVNVESEGRRIDCKVGKAFLLESGGKGGAGQMWSGKIVLDPSHETYKRAKERIGL